jgi:hypothetical protein
MPSTSGLPAVSSILSTERLVATRADGTTVSVLASGLPASGAAGGAGGVLSGSYPNPGFAVDMATQAELDAGLAARANITLSNVAPATGRASLGAAGLDSVTGTLLPAQAPGSLPAVSGSLPTPGTLTVTEARRERLFDLLSERFVMVDEKFSGRAANTTRWLGGSTPPVLGNSGLTFGTTSAQGYLVLPGVTFESPCISVQGWFSASPASGSLRYAGVGLGYRVGLTNAYFRSIFVYYDHNGGAIGAEIRFNGGAAVNLTTVPFSTSGPFALSVQIINRSLSVFVDVGAGWRFVTVWDDISANIDFRTPANLVDMSPFAVAQSNAALPWQLTRLRAGYAGQTGNANPYAIKYENGEIIYDERGRYFLQSTAIHPYTVTLVTNGAGHMHNSIWAVDPITLAAEPVSKVFLRRGVLHSNADVSGTIIYDRIAQLWRVCMQTSSELGVGAMGVNQWTTRENLLQGVHVLSSPIAMNLPRVDGLHGVYDVDLVWRADLGLWHAFYTASNPGLGRFHPRLATSPDLVNFTFAADDTTFVNAEGNRIVRVGGTYYGLAANPTEIRYYSLPSMAIAHTYTPPGWPSVTPPPHPNLIPLRVGTSTKYVIDTFDGQRDHGDGTFTSGNRLVYASPLFAGAEYPLSTPPPRT